MDSEAREQSGQRIIWQPGEVPANVTGMAEKERLLALFKYCPPPADMPEGES